jgi:hypothetical protein
VSPPITIDDALGRCERLVGHDRDSEAETLRHRERIVRACEGKRVVDADLVVDRAEARHRRIGRAMSLDRVRQSSEALEPPRHRALDEHARAVTDPHRDLVARARLHAELSQQPVHRDEDVLDRVDERAVEIKEHGVGPCEQRRRELVLGRMSVHVNPAPY